MIAFAAFWAGVAAGIVLNQWHAESEREQKLEEHWLSLLVTKGSLRRAP